ncbi:MAG: RibD family protein [Candidatus Contendobacter sp.]|jgi:diaminohydroxyphosphoribosylaminopyrimidine deaminase/5-amino-6-(5-phosphoribosylamino)uracil reductase|nr:RibD family protein [Gammaproteobacteria bacterium]MCC8994887.1 RibD family protein [Candidatus Contendobacter sp.]
MSRLDRQPALTEEPVWALLLALRQIRRQWEVMPDRLGLGFDAEGQPLMVAATDPATWIEVAASGRWIAKAPINAAGTKLLDLYLPMALACRAQPLIIAHLGQSLDGRIATLSGASRTLNGPENLTHLHRIRALCDAIVVGANTVECDNPQLTTRLVVGTNPARVILDPRRRLAADYQIFQDQAAPTWLACVEERVGEPGPGHAQTMGVPGVAGQLDLAALAQRLRDHGLFGIFVEGGGLTVSAFLEQGLLDRLQIAIAPLIIGSGRMGVSLPPLCDLSQSLRPRCRRYVMGEDVLFDCWL